MNGARWWPAALVAVLAITVAANIAVYWKANSDPSFAVEPDYYQRAVHWDSTVAARRRSDALHWRADIRLGPPDGGAAVIAVGLTTASGAPVDSADVHIEASFNADGAKVYALRLPAVAAGRYAARIPTGSRGLWRVDLSAVRGVDRYIERVTVDNGAP